ncbi:C6 transcription factor [Penicillium sp. IBT 31633x]|nr:C6 transcription factor [Penicillium sp. IBT 31633x]
MIRHRRRNRTRKACIACQIRKRKCSGTQPCSTCAHLNSDCQYDQNAPLTRPLRSSGSPTGAHLVVDATEPTLRQAIAPSDHDIHLSSAEANSGAAFARSLGLKIDPLLAPKLNMYAWNTGLRCSSPVTNSTMATLPLVDIISQNEMRFLAAVYFEKVHPYYNFIDREEIFRRIGERWLPSFDPAAVFTPYDGVLAGVAALGSLFSQKEATLMECQLADSAKLVLDHNQHFHTPSTDLITAWVLRVSYLRIASTPHLAWIASCTLMHLIEAAGLHLESPSSNILAEASEKIDLDIRRKLFGMARHFTLWISFELGRTRVTLPPATTQLPKATSTGTKNIFTFLKFSESLDPEKAPDVSALEQALTDIMDIDNLRPPMILTQCNLMLCIHRRLQSLNVVLSGRVFDRFLDTIARGLQAARETLVSYSPWHQVANVPFQVVCTLLAIGSHACLALLLEAMQTLRQIATSYNTEVMREAHHTAYLLVKLHQRQKEQDAKALDNIIQTEIPASRPQNEPESLPAQSDPMDQPNLSWMGNAMFEFPSLQNFYLDPPMMMMDDTRTIAGVDL